MNYYELIEPWEPEVLGVKDGLEQGRVLKSGFKNEANYKAFVDTFVNSSFLHPDRLATIDFELECVKLRKGAKLTDFLWFSPKSFCLVSPRVSSMLASHRLAPYKLFPAVIESASGKKIEGYKFFFMPSLDVSHIAFDKCKFEVGNKIAGFKEVTVSSPDDLFSVDDFVVVKKLSLINLNADLDLFKVKLPVGILISEPLYQELASVNVTGIKFKKIEVEVR